MSSSRLEAFSDGVLAIIITIMVLELRLPEQKTFDALFHETGLSLLTYALSFIYVGIYWNNHHHLFQVVDHVDGVVLWANLHLLFWLSLFPLSTSWLDEQHLARDPAILYGANLLGAAAAFFLMQVAVKRLPGGEKLAQALGSNLKGWGSMVLYLVGIAIAFVAPRWSVVPFVVVALWWLVPDPRVERWLEENARD